MNPQSRSFLGAIASAIKAFCLLFINAVNVADNAVSMADKAVKAARKRQIIDVSLAMADYATRAREEAALRQVKAELAMREFIGKDPERQALVTAARSKLDAILAAELAELESKED